MLSRWNCIHVLFAVIVLSTTARAADDPTIQYAAEIARAEALGSVIYEKDRAAAVATDVLLARNPSIDPRLRGWVTESLEKRAWRVSFIGEGGGDRFVLNTVDVQNGRAVRGSYVAYPDGAPLTEMQARMFAANRIAGEAPFRPCAQQYNSVVLPPGDLTGDRYYVYLLAATTVPGVIVVGGHWLIETDAAATERLDMRTFSQGCMEISPPDGGQDAGQPIAAIVTYLGAPHPAESHVFLSKLHGMSLFVVTIENGVIWEVEDGRIRFVDTTD